MAKKSNRKKRKHEEAMLEIKYTVIGVVIWVAVLTMIFFGISKASDIIDAYNYNGGVCRKCGGRYVYIETVGSYSGAEYIYGCLKCGNRIEISHYISQRPTVSEAESYDA